ncbi:MAG: prolipoprotein diacylglyceryl transferase [Sandaracinaceae bacterium]|jgi:phosphatidylglycerol:prolipoprotein diacylglycerol transferase|nr:prolipoprotein diacylglyceryl transferase [Sandaracinaceae bacterium]
MDGRTLQSLLAVLAIVVAVLVRRRLAPQLALPRTQKLALALGALIGAGIGAKLPFLLDDPEATRTGLVWITDGRTLTWGLVGGYLGVEIAKLVAGIRLKTGDSFAPAVAASIAIGRVGCFVGGCCFGAEAHVPWAVDFGDGVPRHPTQLYEAAFHALAFVVLLWMGRRELLTTHRMKAYVITYFVYRFVTEWIRPEPRGLFGLTFYQWSSLAFVVIFALHWWIDAHGGLDLRGERRHVPSPPPSPQP